MFKPAFVLLALGFPLLHAGTAAAEGSLWSGNWALTLGGTGFVGPKFEGSKKSSFQFSPIISLGKQGEGPRYVSRNDNASVSLFDQGAFRAGIAGKLVMPRDADDERELQGMRDIKLGVELGGFAEVYPTENLRVRGEVRQGFRSHHGVVADVAADAFVDVTPNIRVSAGPRIRFASADYFDHYYGVSAAQAASGGPSAYNPGGGVHSVAVGGAIDWKPTDRFTASSFVEYRRLTGPAADSSLVRERGSANQFVVGLSASYKFNFTLD
ncbi:MipA/OmpV family protein [Rhizobiaceae bacterium BDR2-2]|uniref:MipA/OmpV family protein n=1 Tax=Ectorhizobium quercum TaxID=2965071 RepID=A0AAE3SX23_9HYPH|nr:MipA/OmpV family protein [Ectorhizobium quercum]MCX8996342.1 MipA/OmpV family protein [Ectorhizobium quercum]MCX8998619.1 MipA/OmpV family protein [Ectorhizobium quercum]